MNNPCLGSSKAAACFVINEGLGSSARTILFATVWLWAGAYGIGSISQNFPLLQGLGISLFQQRKKPWHGKRASGSQH